MANDSRWEEHRSPLTALTAANGFHWLHGREPGSLAEEEEEEEEEEKKKRGDGEVEGGGGWWRRDGTVTVTIAPPAFKDFWANTFYTPPLVKHDGPVLVTRVAQGAEVTMQVDFALTAVSQFDQAGLFVYVDDGHWCKCGIEFCDGTPRLSVVVTNGCSDWSTQPWPSTRARIRVHTVRQAASSLVVEACPWGEDEFHMVRIAHLRNSAAAAAAPAPDTDWRMGVFAFCAMQQRGCRAVFSNFSLGRRKHTVHSADAAEMVRPKKQE